MRPYETFTLCLDPAGPDAGAEAEEQVSMKDAEAIVKPIEAPHPVINLALSAIAIATAIPLPSLAPGSSAAQPPSAKPSRRHAVRFTDDATTTLQSPDSSAPGSLPVRGIRAPSTLPISETIPSSDTTARQSPQNSSRQALPSLPRPTPVMSTSLRNRCPSRSTPPQAQPRRSVLTCFAMLTVQWSSSSWTIRSGPVCQMLKGERRE